MVTPLLLAVVCFNWFTLHHRIHTSPGTCPPPQHVAAIDALLRFCAIRCNAKRPQVAQPVSFSGERVQGDEVWETDAAAVEVGGSVCEAGLEMNAADDGGEHYPFPWDNGPFVADEVDDAAAPCTTHYSSDQFASGNSSSPRSPVGA